MPKRSAFLLSSRRRHTRLVSDWSSDVCSSDLPDLQTANKIEKQLSVSLGADVLTPVYSYLSLTEESEYITGEDEYAQTLEPSIRNDTAKLDEAMNAFRERIKDYRKERVYPTLHDWEGDCFYK